MSNWVLNRLFLKTLKCNIKNQERDKIAISIILIEISEIKNCANKTINKYGIAAINCCKKIIARP